MRYGDDIPEIRTEPPEPRIVAYCTRCRDEIYRGEIYGIDRCGNPICHECVEREWERMSEWMHFNTLGYGVMS